VSALALERPKLIRRGLQLAYFTIVWNSLEALIALVSGFIAGSVALVGFGLDSLVEVTSGGALLWRLHQDDESRREWVERTALRIVGACFVLLAVYVAYDSVSTLFTREAPKRSVPGILLAAVSLIVMPMLARAKRRVATSIGRAAMSADAKQTEFCTYLSAILLGGLLSNALFGWWWADPIAGLIMVPIIGKERTGALRGKSCCSGGVTCH
jgi:divalent metal cation (Fe/Co/Zn/Cd) transporter